MTVSNIAQANFTRVNTQQSQQASNADSQQPTSPIDKASFSEVAKQLAQNNQNVHSQSGASGTWSGTSNTQPSQNAPTTSSSNDLQSLLMKNILSAYGASQSQNNGSNMSFTA